MKQLPIRQRTVVCTLAGAGLAALVGYLYVSPVPQAPLLAGVVRIPAPVAVPPIVSLFPDRAAALAHLRGMKLETGGYAIDLEWAGRYEGVDTNRMDLDQDGDGKSNLEEMVDNTNPIEGNAPLVSHETDDPNFDPTPIQEAPYEELIAAAKARAAVEVPQAYERRQQLLDAAAAAGIPATVAGESGPASLVDVTPEGLPVYAVSANVHIADGIRADELWPTGSVSGVPGLPGGGWATGASGFALNGTGQKLGLFELNLAPDRFHQQLFDGSTLRVTQYEEPDQFAQTIDFGSHATAVAGVMGSSGIGSSFDELASRGVAFGTNLRSFTTALLPATLDTAAGEELRAANHSYALASGWNRLDLNSDGILEWVWAATSASDPGESDTFGKYLERINFVDPVDIDNKAALNPYSLTVAAAGNSGNEGPGSSVAYTDTAGNPIATPRSWVNGDGGGYDTLNPLAVAKNALVVGALRYSDNGPTGISVVEAYSAAGPTDDGRIKPDLVATGSVPVTPGTRNPTANGPATLDLFDGYQAFATTTGLGGQETRFGGTSAAAPAVTGTFALAMQKRAAIRPWWVESNTGSPNYTGQFAFNQPRSSSLRALAIGTAIDLGAPGPDFKSGYGAFDARALVELVAQDANDGITYNFEPGFPGTLTRGTRRHLKNIELPRTNMAAPAGTIAQTGLFIQYHIAQASSVLPTKVTVAWTDPAGTADAATTPDATLKRLRNDIDVRVYPPGNSSNNPADAGALKPYILNPDLAGENMTVRDDDAVTGDDQINNVEQVVIPAGSPAGDYRVRITFKNNPASTTTQWVSAVMTNVSARTYQNALAVTELVLAGGSYSYNLVISGHAGGVYAIEQSPDLTNWTVITNGNLSLRTDSAAWARTSTAGRLYFRLKRKD